MKSVVWTSEWYPFLREVAEGAHISLFGKQTVSGIVILSSWHVLYNIKVAFCSTHPTFVLDPCSSHWLRIPSHLWILTFELSPLNSLQWKISGSQGCQPACSQLGWVPQIPGEVYWGVSRVYCWIHAWDTLPQNSVLMKPLVHLPSLLSPASSWQQRTSRDAVLHTVCVLHKYWKMTGEFFQKDEGPASQDSLLLSIFPRVG